MRKDTLYLSLKSKWYNMIESGEKIEEYREIKSFWIRRLCSDEDYKEFKPFKYVTFSYGYTRRRMTFEITKISTGQGRVEWGAPIDSDIFIISLGKRIY